MNFKLRNKLRNIEAFTTVYDKSRKLYHKLLVSDEKYLREEFKKKLNRELNLKNPVLYNDKMQWLKLNWEDKKAKECADKYEVRNYIKNTIGEKYLNDIYQVYDTVEDVDLSKLPKSFVLKGTHGSGFNIICKDKNSMNWDIEFKKMRRWLNRNYYLSKREIVYKGIKPRIICEKYLEQGEGKELQDYRFFCFNGIPKFVTVDFSITDKEKTRRNLYDLNWELMDEEISYPKELEIKVEKPEKFNEMLELSKILSRDFPHSRIDFYYIENKIIFGEITFFHQSGMGKIIPSSFEETMGKWIKIPNKIN